MSGTDDVPIPPRWWWLKRLLVAAAVVAVALVGLRLWWGHLMQQRLDAAVQAIRDRGEPVDLQDVAAKPVPDADNAAWHYERAMAAWPTVNGQPAYSAIADAQRQGAHDPIQDNAAYLASLEPALSSIERALACDAVNWGVRLQTPIYTTPLTHLSFTRSLARNLGDAAERAHAIGDDALALRLLQYVWGLSEDVDAPPSSQIAHLVANSIRLLAAEALQELLPELSLTSPEAAAEARALIAQMTDSAAHGDRLELALRHERVMTHDTYVAVASGRLPLNQVLGPFSLQPTLRLRLFQRPLVTAEAVEHLAFVDRLLTLMESQPDYTQVASMLESDPLLSVVRSDPLVYPLSSELISYDHLLSSSYRYAVRQQLAGAALAAKQYEQHHGHLPATLDDLVPDYLPHVPVDPMSPDGKPILYVARGALPLIDDGRGLKPADAFTGLRYVIVYSVGPDGRDDGGLVVVDAAGDLVDEYREGRAEPGDLYFVLDVLGPEVSSASERADDDPDEESAQRDAGQKQHAEENEQQRHPQDQ